MCRGGSSARVVSRVSKSRADEKDARGGAATATLDAAATRGDKTVAFWLLSCCALVFAMVVVGGITRLTHSGLSIVEWQPLVGALPPIDADAWERTFAQYRQTPEY